MINGLVSETGFDASMNELCRNSIELVEYTRGIAAKQINIVQLMTFYSIERWIVEVEQQWRNPKRYLTFLRNRCLL